MARDACGRVGERRDHSAVHVHGVGACGDSALAEDLAHDVVDPRVHREVGRQVGRGAVHHDAVEGLRAAAQLRARGRRDHVDVVAGRGLPYGERTDLRLDATEPRRVAVTDMDDPHDPRPYPPAVSRLPRTVPPPPHPSGPRPPPCGPLAPHVGLIVP